MFIKNQKEKIKFFNKNFKIKINSQNNNILKYYKIKIIYFYIKI